MRKGKIYLVTDKIIGKHYIGQTLSNLDIRMKNHFKTANNKLSCGYYDHFHKMLRFLGKDNFEWKIIENDIPEELLNEKEKYYIEKYDSYENGYNSNPGYKTNNRSLTPSILNIEQVKEIREKIKNTEFSLTNIAKEYNVDRSVISDINCGETWFDENIEYPIRKSSHNKLKDINLNNIINDLKKFKSIKDVAEKYDVHPNTIRNINLGKIHKKEDIIYPIIPEFYKRNNDDTIKEIVDLLLNTDLRMDEIANKLNIQRKSVSNINTGKYHKKDVLKYFPDIDFPIRK